MAGPGVRGRAPRGDYQEAYDRLGNFSAVAREFGVHESAVRRSLKSRWAREDLDPAVQQGMQASGLVNPPNGGWVKTHEKDEHGRTYSWYVRPEQAQGEDPAERVVGIMRDIPAVRLPAPQKAGGGPRLKSIIPINDLHAGSYAVAEETGYGDWDIHKATARLKDWIGTLILRMPVVEECILFYNGDTLHTNGRIPMTGTEGTSHVLDSDSRFFKVVDMTAAAMVVVADLAAQKHQHVRIVIKRGNHDEDSYLALLMAMKYRYRDQKNVTVEEDPSPYWAHQWGNNFWFGHHGDKVKPQDLVMKMASDFREEWGQSEHCVVFTAHKHEREMKTFRGAVWEQASCLTNPDAYGAYWGNQALAQAIVYDYEKGETDRFTRRP